MTKNTPPSNTRRSGIELLRIFAVCGVVLLHYNNPGDGLGQGFRYASGSNEIVLYVLECLFRCGVDVFILISGYFLCQNNKRGLSKPLSLIIMVIVVNLLFYFYSVFAGNTAFSFHELCMELVPHNYFVILYVTT